MWVDIRTEHQLADHHPLACLRVISPAQGQYDSQMIILQMTRLIRGLFETISLRHIASIFPAKRNHRHNA